MKVNFNRIIINQNKDWMINLLTNFVQCKICMNILLSDFLFIFVIIPKLPFPIGCNISYFSIFKNYSVAKMLKVS